ncbi:MAG: CBS domain-containing protein [Patescibacteria group bacterium]|nr:CBS domain-containing protein [Patescibacteria group bacterium]
MKVSDVMSKQIDFVTSDTDVEHIARLIFGHNINGVPVVKDKKLVGFITERDILSKFYPSMQEYVEDPVLARDFEGMEEKISEILSLTADKIMSKNPVSVSPDLPLLKAQSLMFIHKVGRLPVVDKQNNLLGIISKGDIFRSVVGNRLVLDENEEYNDWLSKHYYLTVDWKGRLSLEIPGLIKLFKKNKIKKVIDVGCGTGEHVISLAREGFDVCGVERGKLMVTEANRKRESLPDEIKKRIKFISGEYEDAFAELKKEGFQAAIFMGNTISHNPHNYKNVLKKTAQILTKKSVIILQITNFEKVFKSQKRLLDLIFVKDEDKKEHSFLEFYDLPRKGGTILKTFAIFDSDGRKWEFEGLRNSLFAYLTKDKIAGLLRRNGYKDISFYGSFYDGKKWDHLFRKPFEPLKSDWLNIIAVRG